MTRQFFASALCAALLLACSPAWAQPVKIGFVNPFRIESESTQAKTAIEDLKKEFAPRERQVQESGRQLKELSDQLARDAKTLPESERAAKEKEFNARVQRFEQSKVAVTEDFEARRREALSKVIADANAVIRQIAEAGKFDLILQDSVFFSTAIDITDQVLKAMEKQATGKAR
jgi:outer membrane protein